MAIIGNPTTKLTWAEQKVIEFLAANKAVEYTADEIQFHTDVRADLVDDIMDNLRWKGYDVGSRKGKHWFIKNTILSYLMGGALIATMITILLFSWLGYFG